MRSKGRLEQTVVIIKPDAVQRNLVGAIISRFETNGLSLVRLKSVRVNKSLAIAFYKVHQGKPFFESLVNYCLKGPSVVLLLEGKGAIKKVRELLGATDPRAAKPGTIRADYGLSPESNVVAAANSHENVERLIQLFFPKGVSEYSPKYYVIDSVSYKSDLIHRLSAISSGREKWEDYQNIMVEICTFLFSEYLECPITQALPRSSIRRFDLVLYNSTQNGFWYEMRQQHSANPVVFEFKNQDILGSKDIDQISAYLTELHTSFAIVTCRKRQSPRFYQNLSLLYRSTNHVILPLYDELLITLINNENNKNHIMRDTYMECFFHKDKSFGNERKL
jgi:nucleoside-diphosphate kinase